MYQPQIDHRVFKATAAARSRGRSAPGLCATGNVRILRADGTVAVDRTGSDVEVIHAPTGGRCPPTDPAVGGRHPLTAR